MPIWGTRQATFYPGLDRPDSQNQRKIPLPGTIAQQPLMRRACTSQNMKQLAYIFTASAVIAGCVNQDMNLENNVNSRYDEITFDLVPVVGGSNAAFASTSIFSTGAFYNAPGACWATSSLEASEYLPETAAMPGAGLWHLNRTCGWPTDDGSLTFFGWSLNRDSLSFHPESQAVAGIDRERGVYLDSFDISLDPDADFIVADASSDKILTRSSSSVPTVFRSQLSKIEVSARTKGDYSASKEISISSVNLKNIARTGDYRQGECAGGVWREVHRWTIGSTRDVCYGDYSSAPALVTAQEAVLPGAGGFYIPQTLTEGEQLEVNYTISDIITGFVETVTETFSLCSLIPEGALRGGALHTICVCLALEEISWAPCLIGWEEGSVAN